MTRMTLTRRHFISVAAACGLVGSTHGPSPLMPLTWSGQIMGAMASLTLYCADATLGRKLIVDCLSEIERLESIFSLFRPDSDISRLNLAGWVEPISSDLQSVLTESSRISRLSDGAFDVTVQPLWLLYANHFERWGRDADGPNAEALAQARSRVNWQAVTLESGRISFAAQDMEITLNSIARGYATDRVAALLKAAGMEHVLVDLDNYFALGEHPDGRPWRIGLSNPRKPAELLDVLDAKNLAVASASGFGTVFDRVGKYHHIFDPKTGHCAQQWAGSSVLAKSAMIADALSTTLLVAPKSQAARILAEGGGVKAYMVEMDGQVVVI